MTREHKRKIRVLSLIVEQVTRLGDYAEKQPGLLIQEVVNELWWDWKKRMKRRTTRWVEFDADAERQYVIDLLSKPLCEHIGCPASNLEDEVRTQRLLCEQAEQLR